MLQRIPGTLRFFVPEFNLAATLLMPVDESRLANTDKRSFSDWSVFGRWQMYSRGQMIPAAFAALPMRKREPMISCVQEMREQQRSISYSRGSPNTVLLESMPTSQTE
jgi:hypothetical protein